MGNILSSVRVRFEEIKSLPAGAINDLSYVALGSAFENPVRILKITNLTDADLYISYDKKTAHDVIASRSFYLYDFCTNKASKAGYLEQAAGSQLYVKAIKSLPTINSVHVTVIYASRN